jgi:hypothetical protein
MATISVQDDADVARHPPLCELIEETAFVNPIKKAEEQRSRRALVGRLSLAAVRRGSSHADTVRPADVAARSWAGPQPAFVLFTSPSHHWTILLWVTRLRVKMFWAEDSARFNGIHKGGGLLRATT